MRLAIFYGLLFVAEALHPGHMDSIARIIILIGVYCVNCDLNEKRK
jgi:hypothetical protein